MPEVLPDRRPQVGEFPRCRICGTILECRLEPRVAWGCPTHPGVDLDMHQVAEAMLAPNPVDRLNYERVITMLRGQILALAMRKPT